jgi:curli biogenesis system outer membrane secretion channel CsgG
MNNKGIGAGVALVLAAAWLGGCTSAAITSGAGPDMGSARADAYNGPKARIVVADFEDKMSSGSSQYRREYGRGMTDMMKTALFQSNRYILLEREKLRAVEAERARRKTTAKIEDADIVITAAITGFDPGQSGGAGGLGGNLGGLIGGVAGSFKTARIVMDLRVIDVDTGRVIAATSVEGKSTGVGGNLGGVGGPLGGALGGFAKGPMETAIRDMIKASVDFIVTRTPQTYYRHQ